MANRDLSDVLRNLEHAAADLWTFFDGYTTSCNEYESRKTRDDDVAEYITDLRELRRSLPDSLREVQAFIETMDMRMEEFTKRVEQFDNHISQTAMNYGLSLIPDEVLFEIFSFAAGSLEEKVGLSLVCRRFRTVMMSTRKMWDEHYLEIDQTPEQMVAIAEGNRFGSLKAVIRGSDEIKIPYKAWARNGGLGLKEFGDRFYKRPLDFILSLRLEELWIFELESEGQRILDSVAMQSVRTLAMLDCCYNPVLRSLERRHTPSLQTLWVDFVPGSATGRGLTSCILDGIESAELDSLRAFLASANSLQHLYLYITQGRFYEACDLPSLRSLAANFAPHPSFTGRLTRFTRELSDDNITLTMLTELLDFLSSTEVLQALSIFRNGGFSSHIAPDTFSVNSLRVVTLPYLASCEIFEGQFRVGCPLLVPVLTAKLRMPVLRRLELRFTSGFVSFGKDISDDLPLDAFTIPHERRICFKECTPVTPDFVNRIAGYLPDIEGMQIEFDGCCFGWRSGTFRLDELDSAWLCPDMSSSDELVSE